MSAADHARRIYEVAVALHHVGEGMTEFERNFAKTILDHAKHVVDDPRGALRNPSTHKDTYRTFVVLAADLPDTVAKATRDMAFINLVMVTKAIQAIRLYNSNMLAAAWREAVLEMHTNILKKYSFIIQKAFPTPIEIGSIKHDISMCHRYMQAARRDSHRCIALENGGKGALSPGEMQRLLDMDVDDTTADALLVHYRGLITSTTPPSDPRYEYVRRYKDRIDHQHVIMRRLVEGRV